MFKVKTSNRAAAKRLLNVWHDSHEVRTWKIDQLESSLHTAINEGLITDADVCRALKEGNPKAVQIDENAHTSEREDDNDSEEVIDDRHEDVNARDDDIERQSEIDDMLDKAQSSDATANEGPSSPPPLDSEQPFVTHPELQEAREADQKYTIDVAENKTAQVAAMTLELANLCSKSDAALDLRITLVEKLAKQKPARPTSITIKLPELKKTVKIDSPHILFETVLKYVNAGLNVALVGPAGCGKSYLTQQLATALELDYYTNGALLTKFDLIGFVDASGTYHSTPAYNAFVKGGLHVFDELDASSPEAVVAFNGMTDGQGCYTFPNGMQKKHTAYRAIACMNTFGTGASAEYVGRFRQDAAAMNRYIRVSIDYDRDLETTLASEDITERGWKIRDACERLGIKHIISTRSLVQCETMRSAGATRKEIDRDCLFAGLINDTIKQIKSDMGDSS